jgi:hypothetical protein
VTPRTPKSKVAPLTLTRAQAAEALGISLKTFERHVQPDLRLVRISRLRLVPVRELERWIEHHSARTLEGIW